MKININNRLDPITHQRDWAEGHNTTQRLAKIAMPWLALNSKTNTAMTVGNGLLTAKVHINELTTCLAKDGWKLSDLLQPGFKLTICISQIGLQILQPRLLVFSSAVSHGYQIIILTKDGIIHLKEREWEKAGLCVGEALSSGLFVASNLYGGHLLLALSLSMQGASELVLAIKLLNQSKAGKLDYLEALSNVALGMMRVSQAKDHAKTFHRNKFGHKLSQTEISELFAHLEPTIREACQEDLRSLHHGQEQFDFENYLKTHNISSELKNLDFGRLYFIQNVAFRNLEFIKCSFDYADLKNCSFDNSKFTKTTFFNVWGENINFTNVQFDSCRFKQTRMLNTAWENAKFHKTSITKSAFIDSIFKNVQFIKTNLTESYLNGSSFTDTIFKKCNLYASTFFEAQAKNSKFTDSNLCDTLLCESSNQFFFEGKTVHDITKPVIAYSSDPYEVLEWGDLDDPLVEALRRSGALILMFNHGRKDIDTLKLDNEIRTLLPELESHEKRSIPIQLFENAAPDSEIAKIQKLTHNVVQHCDGVCIPGGAGDVEPSLYGKAPHPYWNYYIEDMMEAGAIHSAMQDKKPIIGICRGAQLTAVMHGGTLKNVEDQWGYNTFDTIPEKGTKECKLFEAIYGDDKVSGISMHSQAIDRIPDGFNVLAQIDDVPKLTTNEDGSILLSQFHPEEYVEMGDPYYMQDIDWEWIYQEFADNPKMISNIKELVETSNISQNKDIQRWKHFFDFYISKASEYRQSQQRVTAAAAA